MWTPILQFLTLIGGGIAIGTILEDEANQPVIIQQVPTTPTVSPVVTETSGTINPLLLIAIAILLLAAGYAIRAFRRI